VVTYRDWPRRLAYLPLLAVQMMGLSLNNGWAVLEALLHRHPTVFLRTPKYRGLANGVGRGIPEYALPVDWKVWCEGALAAYAAATTVAAALLAPGLVWITALYTAGFAWIGWMGLREGWEASRGLELRSGADREIKVLHAPDPAVIRQT